MKLLQIDDKGQTVNKWDSPSQAADICGFDKSHIYKCLKGKRSKHGGFRWRIGDSDEKEVDHPKNDEKSFDYRADSAVLTAKTERSITSLEEAIEFFQVDIKKWEVERFIVNSWDVSMKNKEGSSFKRTNYQVKVYLKKREITLDEVLVNVNAELTKYKPKSIARVKGAGTITAEFADFHIGAEIKDLLRTKDFNVKILSDYLYTASQIINNKYSAENVVVNLHGDFFESISGLNHDDSWKGLGSGMHGANVIILANQLIGDSLLSNINNLVEINVVAGNHDRISASRTVDNKGEAAQLLAWMLGKDFPELVVNYDSLILVRNIDGINHILTHGHHGISKKDLSKVVMDYGDSSLFNIWTEGHIHSRVSKKVLKTKIAVYDTVDFVQLDDLKYRKITLPPMFTGNFFSESIGYAGHAGFIVTYNNGNGIPNVHDYTI